MDPSEIHIKFLIHTSYLSYDVYEWSSILLLGRMSSSAKIMLLNV
jgi:hypothetical protein